MCSSALYSTVSCSRVSGSKKLIQQMYRADKSSPVDCLKRIPIVVPSLYAWYSLEPASATVIYPWRDRTYLAYRLPDLGPPNHVA